MRKMWNKHMDIVLTIGIGMWLGMGLINIWE